MISVLYISYDGMLEPLGQSQVLGYLEKMALRYDIHLISFEKPDDWKDQPRMKAMSERMAAAGIVWTPLEYHKRPSIPATSYDVGIGISVALSIVLRHRIRIIHARSYVSALIALAVKSVTNVKFLFDMRGFWADERVEGGIWTRNSRTYRAAKWFEQRFLRSADHVVTLTKASTREIAQFPYLNDRPLPVTVIPTCADLDRFRPSVRTLRSGFTLGYVGSIGSWYLFEEVLRFFQAIQLGRNDARLLVVNRNEQDLVRASIAHTGINPEKVEITSAEHHKMPGLIGRMDAGAALIKPVYSKIASAPTKVAEYLGCGVPCVGNINVGDMESILEGERVGVALRGFSPYDHREAASRLFVLLEESGIQERCARIARQLFSLDAGVEAYMSIYDELAFDCIA